VHFAPIPTTASPPTTAADDVELTPVEQRAVVMRQLFQTASAIRRRHIYREAKRRGVDRLAWPGLVSAMGDDEQQLSGGVAMSPVQAAVPSDTEASARCLAFSLVS